MATTLDGNRLKNVRVLGQNLSSDLVEVCESASLSVSNSQVTEMSFAFSDTHELQLFRSGMLAEGTSITYGDWQTIVEDVTLKPGKIGPSVSVKCPSKFVTRLRGQTGAYSWGDYDIASWVTAVARDVGMSTLVQPGLGRKSIIREASDGDRKESTWDIITQLSKEVGVWVFEYGSTLVFAKPSWLVSRASRRYWPLHWNTWTDYHEGLQGMPEYNNAASSATRETLKVRLISADADTIRPGDELVMSGQYLGKATGRWIVTDVDFPMTVAAAVAVSCQRPIDPVAQPPAPVATGGAANPSTPAAGAVAVSSGGGAPAGLSAAVDRWKATVQGRGIDMDGAFGAQCVDLARSYSQNVVGTGAIMGNGRDWYAAGGASGAYTQIGPGAQAQKGDIACWGASWGGGWGHVAIVLGDNGGTISTMTQNPGPARVENFGKNGLQGYLRPKRWR